MLIMQSYSVLQLNPSRVPAAATACKFWFLCWVSDATLQPGTLMRTIRPPLCSEHLPVLCFLSIYKNLPFSWICPWTPGKRPHVKIMWAASNFFHSVGNEAIIGGAGPDRGLGVQHFLDTDRRPVYFAPNDTTWATWFLVLQTCHTIMQLNLLAYNPTPQPHPQTVSSLRTGDYLTPYQMPCTVVWKRCPVMIWKINGWRFKWSLVREAGTSQEKGVQGPEPGAPCFWAGAF